MIEVSATAGKGDLKAATLTHRDGGLTTLNLAMDMSPSVPGETVIYGSVAHVSPESVDDPARDIVVASQGRVTIAENATLMPKTLLTEGPMGWQP